VGANTAGSLLGVALAALGVPALGLRATLGAAALLACAVALAAVALARGPRAAAAPGRARAGAAPARGPLLAAALAGLATLAFEVLLARAAALRLGSSLLAWALVLGSFLAALALGNALAAARASATRTPAADLGCIQIAVGACLFACAAWLVPDPTRPAAGVSVWNVLGLAAAVLPAVGLMGAAFPFFVRLGVVEGAEPGAGFGAVSAANTAGGIVGSCLAPFALLPGLGLRGAFAACALVGVGLAFHYLGAQPMRGVPRLLSLLALAGVIALGALAVAGDAGGGRILLFASHGAQASVAVVRDAGRRDLYVDGDPEASTGGAARLTEEWLALLPLALHPEPKRVLEVGLGSGITLGTAARFPLDELACVEIVADVLRAARYFAPQNAGILERAARDPRVAIRVADGRAALLREEGRWDAVLANTVHPGSLGATGLYSREYYERLLRALAPGGIATQWLPLELGEPAFEALVRTFFSVFPNGAMWWGEGNVLLVGAREPLAAPGEARFAELRAHAAEPLARLGLVQPSDVAAREIADAEGVGAALGPGEVLADDRPRLEWWGARQRAGALPSGGFRVVERVAEEAARRDPRRGPLLLFVQAEAARARGDRERADRLLALAAEVGFAPARRAAIERASAAARARFREGRLAEAVAGFEAVLREAPEHAESRFGLAAALYRGGRRAEARVALEALLAQQHEHAEAWNLLGALRAEAGDENGARSAFAAALAADPWYPEALLNAIRLAETAGDVADASALRARYAELDAG
jgi:predicted membrane-bound spermidine synthase/Flp pilus assembly protein TadD